MNIRNKEEYFKDYDPDKIVREFTRDVLAEEGHTDWDVIWAGWGSDSICINETKTLYMGKAWLYGNRVLDSKLHVLHEIAHIKTYPKDNWHGDQYQAEHLRLIDKYLIRKDYYGTK